MSAGLDALILGRCRRNSTGRAMLRVVHGTVTINLAATNQLPRPSPSRPVADPPTPLNAPATDAANVTNDGPVNTPQHACNTSSGDASIVQSRSIEENHSQ